jgi:hypothetical protein
MTIKNLNEILREIMREGRKTPGEWKTLAAPTKNRFGSDLLLFHPKEGPIYQVRAFEKNPYQIEGFGTRIARNVDEDFLKLVKDRRSRGNLGILDLNYRILREALNEGDELNKIFYNALRGKKDQGMDFLNLGDSFRDSQKSIPSLTREQKMLDKKFDRLLKKEGKTSMYG